MNYNMKFIYLDESGNLGFSEKSGEFFVVAALCCEEEKIVDRCIKKARTGLSKKYKKTEMKFSNSSDVTRRRVLSCISKRDISISYLCVKKEWIHSHLRDKKHVIHGYMFGQLLVNILRDCELSSMTIIVDKFLSYENIDEFDKYINQKIPVEGTIKHVSSQSNNGIQAVDFAVGAIHRYYRNNDDSFINIISDKIDLSIDSRETIFKKKF